MRQFFNDLRQRQDSAFLFLALLLLIAAIINPKIPLKRDVFSYAFVVDISQSMNTLDKTIAGKTVSRLDFTKHTLHNLISELPCGTSVSISLFAGASIAALYTPIEVCENYDAISDTIDHLDWRASWSGNSRIRTSLTTLARTIRSFPGLAQVVYFTDGEEAPKLMIFNVEDLSAFQGGDDWLFVGIGGSEGTPIPKLDEFNQLIGYWSAESFGIQPGIATISESNLGTRDNSIAGGESDRYMSKLDEEHLKSLSEEINALYVRGTSAQAILNKMKDQRPARREVSPFSLRWILAGIAGVLFIISYTPKHPIAMIKQRINTFYQRKKKVKLQDAS